MKPVNWNDPDLVGKKIIMKELGGPVEVTYVFRERHLFNCIDLAFGSEITPRSGSNWYYYEEPEETSCDECLKLIGAGGKAKALGPDDIRWEGSFAYCKYHDESYRSCLKCKHWTKNENNLCFNCNKREEEWFDWECGSCGFQFTWEKLESCVSCSSANLIKLRRNFKDKKKPKLLVLENGLLWCQYWGAKYSLHDKLSEEEKRWAAKEVKERGGKMNQVYLLIEQHINSYPPKATVHSIWAHQDKAQETVDILDGLNREGRHYHVEEWNVRQAEVEDDK